MKKNHLQLLIIFAISISSFIVNAQNVKLSNDTNLGQILTDQDGNTLYYFSKDATPNMSSCMGGCVTNWPIFYAENITVDTGLDAADFGQFQRADGNMQTTYKGWPLYYFIGDMAAGDTNGDGKKNVWYVAKPDYSIMLINDILVGKDGKTYNGNYEEGEENIQFFTDAQGNTLYTFKKDKFDTNNFTKDDFSNNAVWPVYEMNLQNVPSTLDKTLFGSIDVFGHNQITYKGWPLYYFGADAQRGDTKGVSVPKPGVWPVAVKDVDTAIMVSVDEIDELSSLSVYPNPFTSDINLTLDMEQSSVLTIDLFNNLGQQIETLFQGEVKNGKTNLTFSELEQLGNGLYFLSIHNEEGKRSFIKLVK